MAPSVEMQNGNQNQASNAAPDYSDADCGSAGGCCRSQSSRYPPHIERFFCNDGSQSTPSVATQAHLFFVFFATVLALVLGNYATSAFGDLSAFETCSGVQSCIKNQLVYRISFAFFLFFLTLALMTFDCCECQWETAMASVHYGWWCMKVFYVLVLCVACLFLPSGVLDVFEHFSRIAGGIFIILQVILLIDFAYAWNETWALFTPPGDEEEEGLNSWRIAVLVFSFLFFVGSWVVIGFMFSWFNASDSCGFPMAIIIVALLSTLILTCVQCACEPPTGVIMQGSLLSSAVVTLTVTFTTFDALYNNPSSCNSLLSADANSDSVRTLVGLLLSAVAVTRGAYMVITNDLVNTRGADQMPSSTVDADGRVGPPPAIREREFFKFHIILAMAMLYMAMLLTDWGAGSSGSAVAMWVKIVTSWVTILLYGWSLVAPLVFPERFQADALGGV